MYRMSEAEVESTSVKMYRDRISAESKKYYRVTGRTENFWMNNG